MSRIARWLGSRLYSWTPLGSAGRYFATRYAWRQERGGGLLPVRRRDQPVCQIFLYHRVNDDADPFLSAVPVKVFRAQMRYLARHFSIVSLDQIVKREFSANGKYYAAVTFDDGYRDNLTCATPVLKEMGIPATIFLATGYIDSGELPWYDRVRLAFKLSKRSYLSLGNEVGLEGGLSALGDRLRLLERAITWLREMMEARRPGAMAELFSALDAPANLGIPNQMLTWNEIKRMTRDKITFGAHTVNHPVLSKIPVKDAQQEVVGSKRAIENQLQLPVEHFAYPFGQPADYSAEVKRLIEEAAFKSAVTTIWGLNHSGDDLFELKRSAPWEADNPMFQLKLDWYRFYDKTLAAV